ncbi:anti-phage dCTP deaminase [Roseateles sp.]|uniref:anti-phage dCTP deaminase n=1 Tax=Roseateles sp. TaxID=1971397 RepID=UPI002F421B81
MSQKLNAPSASGESSRGRLLSDHSSTSVLKGTHTDELVIALCGPIGTPLQDVAIEIGAMLNASFKYEVEIIRVSDFIRKHSPQDDAQRVEGALHRRTGLIRDGLELRRRYGSAVLAELAVQQIRLSRQVNGRNPISRDFMSRRVCHIIQSIKTPQELELLRTVYREVLYMVGVYSPPSHREATLRHEGLSDAEIGALMDPESGAEVHEGIGVDEIFPQCDYFLRAEAESGRSTHVKRFLDLVLGTQVITPTRQETAMHAAASAAGNSACLSRQVGAAVTDQQGEVLAIGWNDVPRPFGDLYVTDLETDPKGDKDGRCWSYGGICHNDEEKRALSAQLMSALTPFIEESRRGEAAEAVFENKKLRSLIEFSRAVHAEMHALLTALRHAGERVRGGQLFVTTYPCHVCARHLVAAGIKEVYFIEPYKKSLAVKLHGDALSECEKDVDKVRLIPFDGVAPTRYLSFFRIPANSRKESGRVIRIAPGSASPRLKKSLEALPALEGIVIESLRQRALADKTPHLSVIQGASTHDSAYPI